MSDPFNRAPAGFAQPLVWMLTPILVILAGWALHATAVVTVPIVFALFLTATLAPLNRAIAARLPGALAFLGQLAVLLVLLLVLAMLFGGLVYAAMQVTETAPRIAERMQGFLPEGNPMVQQVEQMVEGTSDAANGGAEAGNAANDGARSTARDAFNQLASTAGSWLVTASTTLAQQVAGAMGTFVAATIIVVFMAMLALSEVGLWRDKVQKLWPSGSDRWHDGFETMSRKLRGFVLVRAAMGLLTAALYCGWLWFFDVDLLLVWAVLTVLLSFVPNLGSVISGLLPTLFALVTQDWTTALWVGFGLFAIEQVIGNWIDPRVQGRQIAISPLVVLISILIWGWIWGAAGALLAVPLMVALMVGCAHIAPLRPFAVLLSNCSDEDQLHEALKS